MTAKPMPIVPGCTALITATPHYMPWLRNRTVTVVGINVKGLPYWTVENDEIRAWIKATGAKTANAPEKYLMRIDGLDEPHDLINENQVEMMT